MLIYGVLLGFSISTRERNHIPPEKSLWSAHRTDKYLLRQDLVDDPDP
jgi:hypothetical protein